MAAAKKKATPKGKLTKRWTTVDGDLFVSLVAEPGDFDLSIESTNADEFIQLAVAVEQIDEIVKILMTAKETVLRYERGEAVQSDPQEPDEEQEQEGAEEDELEDEDEEEFEDEDEDEDLDDEGED